MNKLLVFILLNLLINSAFAQTWTQKSSIPGVENNSRMASTSFSNYDSYAFVLGGLDGNTVYNDFWQYNAIDDAWIQMADYPGGSKYAHISFVIDSMAYVGFGGNQSGALNTQFWAYNMNSDEWTQIASFPGDGRVYPSAMTINSKGYVGGGVKFEGGNAVYLSDFWEYDPVLDTWTQKADFSGGVRAGAIAFGAVGKGYMGYGESSDFYHWDLYEYSPSGDSWTLLPDVPSTSIAFGSVVTVGNKAYILGGEYQHMVFTSDVWEYDITGDSWVQITSFPDSPRNNAISFVLQDEIYYGTGQIGINESEVTNDLWLLGDEITSLHDEILNSKISVYPNPSNGLFNIVTDQISDVIVINSQGKLVASKQIDHIGSIDLSQFAAGIYFIRLQSGDSSTTKRITIR